MEPRVFPVEEAFPAGYTDTVLIAGNLLVAGYEVFSFLSVPSLSVFHQPWIVWGVCAFDHYMPFNVKPCKFLEIDSYLLVAKHPVVLSL